MFFTLTRPVDSQARVLQHSPVDALSEANVGDAGSVVTEQVDSWVENIRVRHLVLFHRCCRHKTTLHVRAGFAFTFLSHCLWNIKIVSIKNTKMKLLDISQQVILPKEGSRFDTNY